MESKYKHKLLEECQGLTIGRNESVLVFQDSVSSI